MLFFSTDETLAKLKTAKKALKQFRLNRKYMGVSWCSIPDIKPLYKDYCIRVIFIHDKTFMSGELDHPTSICFHTLCLNLVLELIRHLQFIPKRRTTLDKPYYYEGFCVASSYFFWSAISISNQIQIPTYSSGPVFGRMHFRSCTSVCIYDRMFL